MHLPKKPPKNKPDPGRKKLPPRVFSINCRLLGSWIYAVGADVGIGPYETLSNSSTN